MVEPKIFKTDVTASPRRYSFTEEEEQEVWKWEKKKLGVLKVHLMSLSVMFGEKAKRNFYILCKCAIFLSAKTFVWLFSDHLRSEFIVHLLQMRLKWNLIEIEEFDDNYQNFIIYVLSYFISYNSSNYTFYELFIKNNDHSYNQITWLKFCHQSRYLK